MKKIFLEDLEHKGSLIDWKGSVGNSVRFIYKDISGVFNILGYYNRNNSKIKDVEIEYNGNIERFTTGHLMNCKIGRLLNLVTIKFKLNIGDVLKDDNRSLELINREYRIDSQGRKYKYYKYKCKL